MIEDRPRHEGSDDLVPPGRMSRHYASNETCIVPTGFLILHFARLAPSKDQKRIVIHIALAGKGMQCNPAYAEAPS